jgi:hypothetical protein
MWINRSEAEVRRRLASLPKLRDRILASENNVVDRIKQNRELWAAQAATRQQLQKLKDDAQGSRRKELEAVLNKLLDQAVAPEQLAAHPEVRDLAIQWTNRRHDLALALLAVRRTSPRIGPEYDRLRDEASVARALGQLGAPHRLGPAKDYVAQLPRLQEYDEHALTSFVPFYRHNDQMRLGAILDERIPVSFAWRDSSEPTFITFNMAEAIGIGIPADRPKTVLTVSSGRRLPAVRVKIPSIRFGKCLLQDVEAYVLPPEGEDVGAQFGTADLRGYRIRVQPAHLTAVFERS